MVRVGRCVVGALVLAGCPSDDSGPADGTESGTSTGAAPTATADPTIPPPTTDPTTMGGSMSAGTTGVTPEPGTTSTDPTNGDSTGDGPPSGPFIECFADEFVGPFPGPNYDAHGIIVGSHCNGTNHQDIENVERVVFLGDSVTVGTPPTLVADYYRSRLADMLADRFGLEFGANKGSWQLPNPFNGQSFALHSGDFSSCAEWGARNDDLVNGSQVPQCFTEEQRDLTTLTIITSGGNDLARIASDAGGGAPVAELIATAETALQHKRETLEFLTDPAMFPNGSYVVYGNIYEFTDATGEVASCDLSGLAGFGDPIPPDAMALTVVAWMQDEYAKMAVETGTDFIFMFEQFCGHGFNSENEESPCYRGPGNENWFDLTCIHPNPTGHGVLANMFFDTVSE